MVSPIRNMQGARPLGSIHHIKVFYEFRKRSNSFRVFTGTFSLWCYVLISLDIIIYTWGRKQLLIQKKITLILGKMTKMVIFLPHFSIFFPEECNFSPIRHFTLIRLSRIGDFRCLAPTTTPHASEKFWMITRFCGQNIDQCNNNDNNHKQDFDETLSTPSVVVRPSRRSSMCRVVRTKLQTTLYPSVDHKVSPSLVEKKFSPHWSKKGSPPLISWVGKRSPFHLLEKVPSPISRKKISPFISWKKISPLISWKKVPPH